MKLSIHETSEADEQEFLQAVGRSAALHGDWVQAPAESETFHGLLEKCRGERNYSYLARASGGELVGCVNLNEVVRGAFHSTYLGFYAFEPMQGQGHMKVALSEVIGVAFGALRLHRVEANVQPDNERSLALVKSLGFRHEGFSPRYLRIADSWRDHERFAVTVEDWASGEHTPNKALSRV